MLSDLEELAVAAALDINVEDALNVDRLDGRGREIPRGGRAGREGGGAVGDGGWGGGVDR